MYGRISVRLSEMLAAEEITLAEYFSIIFAYLDIE